MGSQNTSDHNTTTPKNHMVTGLVESCNRPSIDPPTHTPDTVIEAKGGRSHTHVINCKTSGKLPTPKHNLAKPSKKCLVVRWRAPPRGLGADQYHVN